ncbi:MAG: glycine--tRNA ligase subunit beta [Proteobacteria bacterium]|nr:MAG: glycine--tRNA ligase subunit beta [Pseudomonadota bacterium]QKK10832.1 MAG: glycine--tRNA ligase subunit beta [Pseudomonadota bacterium]
MVDCADLLIEIGTEELPPKALRRLSTAFTQSVVEGLAKAGLSHGTVQPYATPRRLAMVVKTLQTTQADRRIERRGPALAAAFDEEGNPTRAALGFAGSCGVAVEALETLEGDTGAWLVFRSHEPGRPAADLLPAIVEQALAALPIPKRMRWGSNEDEFVRPVHWVVLLLGETVIDARILGLATDRTTRGHRFHHPQPLVVHNADGYAALLESEGGVMPDFAARRAAIEAQVREAATALGGQALMDDDLLDEVTALVEWPTALAGRFDQRFLDLPAEVLVCTMKGNQKYFPVTAPDGALKPHFITVSNIRSTAPAQVIAGNERVIRPRLADAAFFWEQDRKRTLEARVDTLKTVVFQERLGTLHDKALRVAELAAQIAQVCDGDPALARRAALLAKCDLLTEMVGEFPELQGIMGRYYAHADGEPAELCDALDEQYLPRFAGDVLPSTPTGRALAIADRIDTLVGIFGIGQLPTGDKDPYALRRAALGVLRIIIENQMALDVLDLVTTATRPFAKLFDSDPVVEKVYDFMMERLRAYYTESAIAPDVFESVLARRPEQPHDFDCRLRAVAAFRQLPEAASLAAANKRIRNILRKTEEPIPEKVDANKLRVPEELALSTALSNIHKEVTPLLERGAYSEALTRMASLREPVDRFFDEVMVMDEDQELRRNRLALLATLSGLFMRIADLSQLQG